MLRTWRRRGAPSVGGIVTGVTQFAQQCRLRAQLCDQRERLMRIAWSWCQSTALADDLVQETLTRALAKLGSLRDEERLEVWVTRIMVNLYRDQYRRTEPESAENLILVSEDDGPEQLVEREDMVRRTRHALWQLSEGQRQVIALVDLSEFSYADTARILDLPVGTVMSRLWRARQNLRRSLEKQLGSGHPATQSNRRTST